MKKSPLKSKLENTNVSPLRSATCTALSGKSTLAYDLGQAASKALHFRVAKNDGGGFFSPEWVVWKDLQPAIAKSEPVTSICLRSLFKGKSVNTSGFLLAVLLAEGLLEQIPKKKRLFRVTGKTPIGAKASRGNHPLI